MRGYREKGYKVLHEVNGKNGVTNRGRGGGRGYIVSESRTKHTDTDEKTREREREREETKGNPDTNRRGCVHDYSLI